jgi:hypothetical protein
VAEQTIPQEKPRKRLIRMNIPEDLYEAIIEMAGDPDDIGGRTLHNMIQCSLKWAVWAHSQGRGPDVEMLCSRRGYTKWNEKLRCRSNVIELGGHSR